MSYLLAGNGFTDTVVAGTDDNKIYIPTGIDIGVASLELGVALAGSTKDARLDLSVEVKSFVGDTGFNVVTIASADYTDSCAVNRSGYFCVKDVCVKQLYALIGGGAIFLMIICYCAGKQKKQQKNKQPQQKQMFSKV